MPVQERYSTFSYTCHVFKWRAYLKKGTVSGEMFAEFVDKYHLPCLMPFNGINARPVVVMDNAGIHHIEEVKDKAGARLHYLPDLMPAEGVFSQVKSIIKGNNSLFEHVLYIMHY